MAKMFPDFGPKTTSSPKAEPKFYNILKNTLSDDFTVVHSIPWLSSALVELYDDPSGIGEVDFLIIHPELGVLAIEVKGGNFRRDNNGYYYSQGESRSHFDPFEQLNRGVFALQKLLRESGIRTRFGKAYYFPETDYGMNLAPEYLDYYLGKKIRLTIERSDTGQEALRIESLMKHYHRLLGIKSLGKSGVLRILECIFPTTHHGACWVSRIQDDKTWLKLTNEQNDCVNQAINSDRYIVTGWPGSGKTIVLIQACRELVKKGKKTLVVTFNRLLSEKIQLELKGLSNCTVLSFHRLCCAYSDDNDNYQFAYHDEAVLEEIVTDNRLSDFDTLLVDEGQAISKEAWSLFIRSFSNKQIIVMCDDAQAFGYEKSVSISFLTSSLDATPFLLTESLRMPKSVCDELRLFSTPSYSVINKRSREKDTLHRIVTHDQIDALRMTVARLLSDGVVNTDICVLKPGYVTVSTDLVPRGVLIENIGRFRGLEKPIVIIFASERINDSEFFCAYSRATSRCIVLLDANFIRKGRYGQLGIRLLKSDTNRVNTIANRGLIKNKISSYDLTREVVSNGIINLEWFPQWKVHVFYSTKSAVLQELISSYIEVHGIENVVSWSPWSVEQMRICPERSITINEHIHNKGAVIEYCETCKMLIPHHERKCIGCDENNSIRFTPKKLKTLTSLILKERALTCSERENICPLLAAILTVSNHPELYDDKTILNALEKANSYICQSIIIFIFFIILKATKDNTLKNKDVITFVNNSIPSINKELSESSFAAFVANGMNKLVGVGALERVTKGTYKITFLNGS
ncbi:AAA family ATPase [Shewanella atlantica]|uniref:nuclease-related domain-containing DEAD/DEAH box helicase n=1 Tax=Shewanella atlantica TaxID=271099 RepID=UPI00373545AA